MHNESERRIATQQTAYVMPLHFSAVNSKLDWNDILAAIFEAK